jgi:hypothetical protein
MRSPTPVAGFNENQIIAGLTGDQSVSRQECYNLDHLRLALLYRGNEMECLRFLHIPKTGGGTFISILERQYAGKNSFQFSGNLVADKKKYEALSEEDQETITLFTGHAPIVTGIERADQATIITILRDPISRVRSYCQFVFEGKIPNLAAHFPPEAFDLDKFLECGLPELFNLQTRLLARRELSWSFHDISAPEDREVALDNLFNKISHFGLQEFFDESLVMFSSALNWKLPLYVSRNRKNSANLLRFEKRHIERIAEMNAIDLEVYRLARERFIRVFKSSVLHRVKLKWFQLKNRQIREVR